MTKLGWVLILFLPGLAIAVAGNKAEPRLAVGSVLPVLEGSFLSGAKARLPEASRGRIALLALGFTYESRYAVEAWCERFAQEFAKSKNVTFYEIPVIGGIGRLARWFIDSGMRRGTPKEKHENVITVYGGVDAWKQRVGYAQPKDAYLILLGPQGTVQWLHAGPFDESQFAALATAMRRIQ
jgi:hypothetical protein